MAPNRFIVVPDLAADSCSFKRSELCHKSAEQVNTEADLAELRYKVAEYSVFGPGTPTGLGESGACAWANQKTAAL